MSDTISYTGQLGPLIEGEEIAYSFLVPGWYMVLGILLLGGLVIAILQVRKYRRNAYRREALTEVERILAGEPGQWSFELGRLLKELAMEHFEAEKVASMQGLEWYAFLRSSARETDAFLEKDFERFAAFQYNGQTPDRELGEKLGDFARHWIRTHQAGKEM